MKPEQVLIYSDLDGTMLFSRGVEKSGVPASNIAALNCFMEAGGAFSIATGRKYSDTVGFFQGIEFSAPLVMGNGSYIMDPATQAVLYRQPLDEGFKESALKYAAQRKDVFLSADDEYVTRLVLDDEEKCRRLTNPYYAQRIAPAEYLRMSVTKLCFLVENAADVPALIEDIRQIPGCDSVRSVQTDDRLVEVVQKSVSKASGIERAVRLAGLEHRTLVCIGDYYNDLEMLRMADIAACPANSPKDVRDICDIITCGNDEGALAFLIDLFMIEQPIPQRKYTGGASFMTL